MGKCGMCDGAGEYDAWCGASFSNWVKCDRCNGTGRDETYTVDAMCTNCGEKHDRLNIKYGALIAQRACPSCGCASLVRKP